MAENSGAVCPLVAAYSVGRHFWEVSWAIEQASLLPNADAVGLADQAFNALLVDLGDAVSQTADEPSIEVFVQMQREDWHALLRSEGYTEEYLDINDYLNHPEESDGKDPEDRRQEQCHWLLRHVCNIPVAICEKIVSRMDDDSILAFRLGECFEQGLRPSRPYRWMNRPVVPEQEAVGQDPEKSDPVVREQEAVGQDPEKSDLVFEDNREEASRRRRSIASHRILPGEIPPEPWWAAQLRRLWKTLDLPMDPPPELPQHDAEGAVAPIEDNGQKIDEIIRQALTDRTGRPPYLDLRLDEKRRLVWRDDEKVDFQNSNLGWALLKALLKGRGEPVPLKEIWKVWSSDNGAYAKQPAEGTVPGQVTVLRKLIKPLNVAIKAVRNGGYRLVDCS